MSEGFKFSCSPQTTQDRVGKGSCNRCLLLSFISKILIFVLIFLLRAWKVLLSPYLGSHCRFNPTCSVYAIEALRVHGLLLGGWMATKRVVRCNPWSRGGDDPVR